MGSMYLNPDEKIAKLETALRASHAALAMVEQWSHGLRHRTAHESKMVDGANVALAFVLAAMPELGEK